MSKNKLTRGELEFRYHEEFMSLIGIDEVGRGCIAGPVVAGCVALDYEKIAQLPEKEKSLIRDSKKLSSKQRQAIIPTIKECSIEFHIGAANVAEIDRINILQATFLAMKRALAKCKKTYDLLLVDGGQQVAGYKGKQVTMIGGDDSCYAIAAASILAKEYRDSYMRKLGAKYEGFGFERHVGYGTREHLQMLEELGPCPSHRTSFAPVKKALLMQRKSGSLST